MKSKMTMVYKGKSIDQQSFLWTKPYDTPYELPINLDEVNLIHLHNPVEINATFHTDTVELVVNIHSHMLDENGSYVHINDIYTGYGPHATYVYLNIPLTDLGLEKDVPYKLKYILETATSKTIKTKNEQRTPLLGLYLDKCIKDGVEKSIKHHIDGFGYDSSIDMDYGGVSINWKDGSDMTVKIGITKPQYLKCNKCHIGGEASMMHHVASEVKMEHICKNCYN